MANFAKPSWRNGLARWTSNSKVVGSSPIEGDRLVWFSLILHRDYFIVGECVRFLFTSCEGSLNERVSAANE